MVVASVDRVKKAKNAKSRKALLNREPKLIENVKSTVFVKGRKTSALVLNAMKDLFSLKRCWSEMLKANNEIIPFENCSKIEHFCRKGDHSLFIFGSHNKKRPHNLVFGRTHDHQVLDMIEVGITNFKSLSDFSSTEKVMEGLKPCLVFNGPFFESSREMVRLKNLLIDMFRGPQISNVNLAGVEHCIQFSSTSPNTFQMRSYKINLSKSSDNTRIPHVTMQEIGPSFDFTLRRTQLASDSYFKSVCPNKELTRGGDFNLKRTKNRTNVSKDEFGSTVGRVFRESQNLDDIETRKVKALKKDKKNDENTNNIDLLNSMDVE